MEDEIDSENLNATKKQLSRHLSLEEMKNFIELKDLSLDSIRLIGRVNGHLMNCRECVTIFEEYKKLQQIDNSI